MKSIHVGRAAVLLLLVFVALPAAAQAASRKPVVKTGAATDRTPSTVTLNGSVDPNGAQTVYFFQIGLTSLYGSDTTVTSAGNGRRPVKVSAPVTGLAPATRYHYRLVAQNRNGLVRGPDRSFRTPREPFGLALGATPNPVRYNGSTTLSGRLTGTGNAGQQVVLQSNPFPHTQGFANVGNALVTDAAGAFSFPVLAVPINTQFRVLMPEKPDVVSPIVTVGVKVRVSTKVNSRRIERGRRVRFTGRLTPPMDGQPVLVQKLVRGNWVTVARATARRHTTRSSRYRRRVKLRRGGTFRVVGSPTDGQRVANAGRSIRIKVRR